MVKYFSKNGRLPSTLTILCLWSLFILALAAGGRHILYNYTVEMARNNARGSWEKDTLYRLWGAMHGGVYVPVTKETRPNPYLKVPERDVTTTSGRQLTLINPAYMTRQVYELAKARFAIQGHITSLKPIRPQNAPDPWEARALKRFEKEQLSELSEITLVNGQPYLRFMRPFVTRKECLKCHAQQGYKIGDIRGGISIFVPMADYFAAYRHNSMLFFLAMAAIWLMGCTLTFWFDRKIRATIGELHNSEREKESILTGLDRMGLGLSIIDQDFTIRYLNQTMIAWFGNQTGQCCYEALAHLDHPCPDCKLPEVLQREHCLHYTPSPRQDKTLSSVAIKIQNVDGTVSKLEIAEDITEKVHLQAKQKELEAQKQRASKMEAIALTVSGVAHDLNNILSGIVSYPDLLLLQMPEDSPLREPVKAIRESGTRAAAIVSDLLTITRGTACAKHQTDLNQLIEEYLDSPECKELRRHFPSISIDFRPGSDLRPFLCSAVHIKKSLMNLVNNAAEAMHGSGTITITSRLLRQGDPEHSQMHLDQNDYLVLEVHDTGEGISAQECERIFEPFFTKKKMGRSGTGLGLAIVWNTVHDHGGTITVNSGTGETVFRLYFPCDTLSPQEETAAQQSGEKETFQGQGERILVVDDERLQRDIAQQILSCLGYTVFTADSGEQAVAFLQDNRVDLVLLDMVMGSGMDGRQTYEAIIALHPGQKALIVSGFAENEDVEHALRLGASGFLQKPYSLMTLGQAIRNVLDAGGN